MVVNGQNRFPGKFCTVHRQKILRCHIHRDNRGVLRNRSRLHALKIGQESAGGLGIFPDHRLLTQGPKSAAQRRRTAHCISVRAAMVEDQIMVMAAEKISRFPVRHCFHHWVHPQVYPVWTEFQKFWCRVQWSGPLQRPAPAYSEAEAMPPAAAGGIPRRI